MATSRRLTALPGACSGRYLPGARAVLVSHDDGGNERAQISRLPLGARSAAEAPAGLADLEPVVHDPRFIHDVADVTAEHLCYLTNRRNSVDFDVIIRDLATGDETVVFDDGGAVRHAAMSPDGRSVAVMLSSHQANSDQILLVDLTKPAGADRVSAITGADEHAQYGEMHFTPTGDALLVTTDRDAT